MICKTLTLEIYRSSVYWSVTDNKYCAPAVDVKQNARPAKHDDPIDARPPAKGKEMSAPIASDDGRRCSNEYER